MNAPHSTQIQPTRVAVLHPLLPFVQGDDRTQQVRLRSPESALTEATDLCQALPLDVVYQETLTLRQISARSLIGKGKVAELKEVLAQHNVALVVVNTRLHPTQQRNLEVGLNTKVIDRTGLILEIFADRAQTHAGRLQVALAQLQYQANRLVRSWTHLERQRGGLGKTGGPGERQIELDRRMIRDKIDKIRKELSEVEKTRALHRKGRIKSNLPVVALVGYTNAGKSTLFNALAGENAFVKDMLFATLDPLMRKVRLNSGREVILSDTVGFVSELPHELITAFHATLEEVVMADLILHVQDASSPERAAQEKDVIHVLSSIGAEALPQIYVYNKHDIAPEEVPGHKEGVCVSAQTGYGLEALQSKIEAFFASQEKVYQFVVLAADGRKIAWLQAHGDVRHMHLEGDAYHIDVLLSQENANWFKEAMQT